MQPCPRPGAVEGRLRPLRPPVAAPKPPPRASDALATGSSTTLAVKALALAAAAAFLADAWRAAGGLWSTALLAAAGASAFLGALVTDVVKTCSVWSSKVV